MIRRATLTSAFAVVLATTSFSACSGGKKSSEFPDANGCPEGAEQIAHMDWGLKEPIAGKVRAGLMASQHLELLAVVMETDLLDACTALAKDMYATDKQIEGENVEPGGEAAQACNVAAESLGKLRGIAGGTLTVNKSTAVCLHKMDAADACFKACDPSVKKPALECMGESGGVCDGNCSGQCSVENESSCSGSCSGLCNGKCDSEFKGECRGKCEGECDGKKSVAECKGECVGRCTEGARGKCGGVCAGSCNSGSCTIEAMGECEGVCAGTCDKKLKEPTCQGSLTMDKATECQSSCETILLAEIECTRASVDVTITEPENEEAAAHLKKSLESHLPKILQSRAMAIEAEKVTAAVDHTNAAITAMKEALATPKLVLNEKQKSCAETAEAKVAPAMASLTYAAQAADSSRLLIDP